MSDLLDRFNAKQIRLINQVGIWLILGGIIGFVNIKLSQIRTPDYILIALSLFEVLVLLNVMRLRSVGGNDNFLYAPLLVIFFDIFVLPTMMYRSLIATQALGLLIYIVSIPFISSISTMIIIDVLIKVYLAYTFWVFGNTVDEELISYSSIIYLIHTYLGFLALGFALILFVRKIAEAKTQRDAALETIKNKLANMRPDKAPINLMDLAEQFDIQISLLYDRVSKWIENGELKGRLDKLDYVPSAEKQVPFQ
ncbi:MAG: hypothetical protein ACP6IP_09095 [Candidatus Njordarchaeia archaeon]